jgi:hypothetical protein
MFRRIIQLLATPLMNLQVENLLQGYTNFSTVQMLNPLNIWAKHPKLRNKYGKN